MKYFMMMVAFYATVYAATLSPRLSIEAGGNVQSIALHQDIIIAGTSAGTIEGYHLSDGAFVFKITFDSIKDFMGDMITPKVFSIDKLEGEESYIAVLQASNGARSLQLVSNGVKKELISSTTNMFISKAKFIDKNRILLALMSNELVLWDIAKNQKIYQVQVSASHFSDFTLNETKSLAVSSCESGEVSLTDVATGKVISVFRGGNVDNVYKVDIKKNTILCAGQDRRGIIYDIKSKDYERFDGDFLIYAGALSPSSKLAAFAFNEKNDIVIFDLNSKAKAYTLRGQKSTLNTIVFANEKELVSGSDDKFIMIWRLP